MLLAHSHDYEVCVKFTLLNSFGCHMRTVHAVPIAFSPDQVLYVLVGEEVKSYLSLLVSTPITTVGPSDVRRGPEVYVITRYSANV